MLKKDIHRLLKRQLKKSGFSGDDQERLSLFLNMVNDAYQDFDKDILHIEHILEESSKELFRKNLALKTEHDTTKNQLNNIINNVHGVLFQTDLKGNFVYLNQAWKEVTGLSLRNSLGKNFRELLKGKNEPEKERLERFLKEGNPELKTVFKYFQPNGEKKYIEVNLSLTYDNNGQPNGTIGTMIDVTNLKETEIKLNIASKAKDDFLSTMSHEMRTPLNAVIGLTNILLMEDHLPSQVENLNALKYSGEHLLNLINDVLDLNKIQSGKVTFDLKKFNLNLFLKKLQLDFKHVASHKFLVFKISIDQNIPEYIIGDSHRLAQILKNLLSNAFKFTDKGIILLKVSLLDTHEDNIVLSFNVKDTGIGVPKHKQKQIFKSFVQAEANTTRLYGGTGLGLTISKKLLNMQNSDLFIKSEEGKGSEFWFNLHFDVPKDDTTTDFKQEMKPKTSPINLKVLVAEDNKLNCMVLKKLFEKWKIDFTITHNGKELLDVYKERDFDLILMDLQMPLMDGYEAAKIIRELPDKCKAEIPIIALTAFAQQDIKAKTEAYKMNGFMSKPFKPNEFHKLLSEYTTKKVL